MKQDVLAAVNLASIFTILHVQQMLFFDNWLVAQLFTAFFYGNLFFTGDI
jgi:hypothetical protein